MVEITHAVSPETHSAQRLLKGAQDLCVGWEFYEGGYMKNGNKLLVCLSLLAGLFIWSGCGSNSTSTGTCSSGQYLRNGGEGWQWLNWGGMIGSMRWDATYGRVLPALSEAEGLPQFITGFLMPH